MSSKLLRKAFINITCVLSIFRIFPYNFWSAISLFGHFKVDKQTKQLSFRSVLQVGLIHRLIISINHIITQAIPLFPSTSLKWPLSRRHRSSSTARATF